VTIVIVETVLVKESKIADLKTRDKFKGVDAPNIFPTPITDLWNRAQMPTFF
jgi:hypothetical protein